MLHGQENKAKHNERAAPRAAVAVSVTASVQVFEKKSLRIAIACDHRGFEAKRKLLPLLKKMGHFVDDFGCDSQSSVDYPDFAEPVARSVSTAACDVGILLDGSGIGMSIVANKLAGCRAALVHDEITARRAREHHHCNVLCLGCDLISEGALRGIVEVFLATPFGEGRHARRVEKLKKLEAMWALKPV